MAGRRISRWLCLLAIALWAAPATAHAAPSFDGGRLVDSGTREIGIEAGDFNGDGYADVFTANSNGTADLLRNRHDNWFVLASGFPRSATGNNQNLVTGDFNADGDLDAALVAADNGLIRVFLGDGAGGIISSLPYSAGASSQPFDVATADFNGDGALDIVTANQANTTPTSAPTVTLRLNTGSGGFAGGGAFTVGGSGALARGIAAGDVNGDGHADVLVANTNAGEVRVLVGDGAGGLTLSPTAYATGAGPRKVVLADLDLDGDLDFATADSGDGVPVNPALRGNTITVMLNDGTGAFTAAPGSPLVSGAAMSAPYALEVADLDGDGWPDLATVQRYGGTLSVLRGTGAGTFAAPLSLPYPDDYVDAEATDLTVGDVNHDGRPDLVGNAAGSPGYLVPFLNTTVVAPPTVSGVDPASPGSDATPLVTGTTDGAGTVRLYTSADCSGAPVATGTADAFGGAGIAAPAGANTSTTYWATLTNAAGWGTSACSSTSVTYEHDDIAPNAPSGLGTTPVSPSNDTTPLVSAATVEPGSTVRLYAGGDCTGSELASGTAAAFLSPGIEVTVAGDATTSLRATATDAAGNASACSDAVAYATDTTPPDAPSGLATTPASPTPDATPVVSGTAEAGSSVTVWASADCTTDPLATGSAADFATPGLEVTVGSNSTTSLAATATDAAGNVSACSSTVAYTHDSVAPDAPTGLFASPASPSTDATPVVFGTAEAGATVRVYDTADCTGTPLATGSTADLDATGLTVAVAENDTTSLRATATDAAGNTSGCSDAVSYTHDTIAPDAPTGLATTPASPSADDTPTLTGAAEDDSIVRVYDTSDCSGTAVAVAAASSFAAGAVVTVAANATTSLRATATDAAGNTSACSSAVSYTHDDVAPDAPTDLATTPTPPSNDDTPLVSGEAESGSTVRVYATADCSGMPLATGTAADFASPGLEVAVDANSAIALRATATDPAGNPSACSAAVSYVEDSTAPSAPADLATTPASPSTDATPLVTGTAEAGTTVRVYATSDCTGTPLATGSAADFASPGLEVTVSDDATTALRATATDAAGNASACSAARSYTHDATAPAAPTDLATTPASPSTSTAPQVTGTAEAGSTVRLYLVPSCAGTPIGTATAADFASPGFATSVPTDAATTYYATATDAAGNTSACSAGLTYVHATPKTPDPPPTDTTPTPTTPTPTPDPPPSTPPQPIPPPPPTPPSNAFTLATPTGKTTKRSAVVTVGVTVPGPGTIDATVTTADRRRTLSARIRTRPTKAGRTSLKITLNATARKLLRRSPRLQVRVRVTFTPRGGSPREQTRPLTLRRPR